jgi:hypothetical protein
MRSTLLRSIPLVALVGCTIHTGPGGGSNTAPPPATPAATPATPAPATTGTTAVTATPTATAAPTGTVASGPPAGLDVKKPMLRAPEINKGIVFGAAKPTDKTIPGEVFEIPVGTKQLPNFAGLTPLATLYTTSWDVAPRKFEEGFPGVNNRIEWFAIRWKGTVKASKAGVHVFKVKSDDGARVFIDGQLVLNNDGAHPPTEATGQTLLNAGDHDLEIQYFQGPKFEIALQIWVTVPGTNTPKIFSTTF